MMIKQRKLICALVSITLGLASFGSLAADVPVNAIKAVQPQQEGDRFLLKIEFEKALESPPAAWTTAEPARIVFDFPGVNNTSGKASYLVNKGGVRNINVVQTEQQTRLVLNMLQSMGYSTQITGNVLLVSLTPFSDTKNSPGKSIPTALTAPTPQTSKLATQPTNDPVNSVRDIVFRRGEQGQATITIDLVDGSIPVDIRREGSGVTVDLQNTVIPDRLLSKRDVIDFATPVTAITSNNKNDLSRITITAKGQWVHSAQLVNNQLVLEIKPLALSEVNRLVPFGESAKKISINFYDADLAMVLRTLAELSGKNVIVDPSLSGKKITVTLDNMPYDQALEVVLAQTATGMRIKDNLIVFGARDVLLKRDLETADELSRANETAPLIAESFQLNYILAGEILNLITLAKNDSTDNNGKAVATDAKGGNQALVPRGLLSSRGTASAHQGTNRVWIKDTQSVIDQIRKLIQEVDVPAKQVLIEARIVEVSTDFTNNLGVRLNLFNKNPVNVGGWNAAGGTASTSSFSSVDAFGLSNTPTLTKSNSTLFGTSYSLAGSTAINLMLFNSDATRLITMELAASETDAKSKTISTPRVVTQNRKAAKIDNTQQVTLLVGVNAQTGLPIYQTYSAPLTLDVTPSITPDNKVSLDLKIAKSTLKLATGGANTLDTNNLNTNVTVENGGTVVIGGFYREGESESQERVPVLGDLPYVGFLFKATTKLRSKSELLVFITPRVLNDALSLR